jgi:hypothetical protein
MKLIATLAAFAILAGFSLDASAQDGKKKGERGGKRREALLKKFDKDGDGKLSEDERKAAREFKAKRRADEGRDGKGRGEGKKRAFRKSGGDGESPKKFRDSRPQGKGRHQRRR